METVAKGEIGPAVGCSDSLVHLDVEITEIHNTSMRLDETVEPIICLGQTFSLALHYFRTQRMVRQTNLISVSMKLLVIGTRERIK
jgi:hypothetical protein